MCMYVRCVIGAEYGTYTVSKAGVSRLTELLVDTIGKDPAKPGILINSVMQCSMAQ